MYDRAGLKVNPARDPAGRIEVDDHRFVAMPRWVESPRSEGSRRRIAQGPASSGSCPARGRVIAR